MVRLQFEARGAEAYWRYIAREGIGSYYATNREGEGLFLVNVPAGTVRQLRGTGQFHVRDLVQFKRTLRRELRRVSV